MRPISRQLRIAGGAQAGRAIGVLTILLLSAIGGLVASHRAVGLTLYARDALMRARGEGTPSDEIVVVAIDEASIAKFGRFPWARAIMARAIERIAQAGPRAIAFDVLYADATNEADDRALAEAVARAGNVVAAAQLVAGDSRQAVWLRPLPAIAQGAAGIGHVNIAADQDGVARALLLRQVDDEAAPLWAMALETLRVGEGRNAEIREKPDSIRVGTREIPVAYEPQPLRVDASEVVRAARLTIDYAGPAGTFGPRSVSLADLLDGRVPAERLRGKYVLIGATANTLGDRLASPFIGRETEDGNQHATLMPGVEILANSLNTILQGRFYATTSEGAAFLCALLAAAAALAALGLAQGRGAGLASAGALLGLTLLILVGARISYARFLIEPPLIPMLGALMLAVPLGLLRRTLTASSELDARIAELARASDRLTPTPSAALDRAPSPAALIARMSGATAVAILRRDSDGFAVAARHGASIGDRLELPRPPHASVTEALQRDETAERFFRDDAPGGHRALALRLGEPDEREGALLLAYPSQQPPDPQTLQLCRELAADWLAADDAATTARRRGWLSRLPAPQGLRRKAATLQALQQRWIRRSHSIDRALQSVEDGLLLASTDGVISFANPRAGRIFGLPERALPGKNLFALLLGEEDLSDAAPRPTRDPMREMLTRLLVDRAPVEREITLAPDPGTPTTRHYIARLAPVCERLGQGPVTSLVATVSDVTRHYELQQMKNDVMALVTHELRTPITAIQGMSEVLAEHPFTADEQREMHAAINDEARRLARMIDEYLDLARLESGARPLRRETVRVTTLLERTLLLLEPIAARRDIRLVRRFAPNLPPLLADADLLSRAVNNLVTNAIKYSPNGREIIIETGFDDQSLRIAIRDHGDGIPPESIDRIFEKFYRVPRIEPDEVPGTGLGLAFVREVAEMHGGRVTVDSEPGVGSAFTLSLPRN